MHAQRRRAARAGPGGRALALQPEKYIVHFPETREIWSFGSGYGGNALLGKKCFGLRIASNIARDEGWMAEHMLILGVEDPQGEKTYISAAFPSACGKTNLAMLIPPDEMKGLEGLDGRRRHRLDQAGRERTLARDQSGGRRVRRRARHVARDQPERDGDRRPQHDLHQRRPDARGRRVVGRMTDEPPAECLDWRGERWTPEIGRDRGRRGASQRAIHRAGGAVPDHRPDWEARTACRSAPSSSAAAARRRAARLSGVQLELGRLRRRDDGLGDDRGRHRQRRCVRRDPMAMLPFCGYHMGDYFRHWIKMQRLLSETPKIFHVNWFRKDADGRFSGPGFARTCAC